MVAFFPINMYSHNISQTMYIYKYCFLNIENNEIVLGFISSYKLLLYNWGQLAGEHLVSRTICRS